jgi:hypothetical protein
MEFTKSMKFVYFGVGFTLAATVTMFGLSFVRPMLTENTPRYIFVLCMLSPLIIGVPYGLRVIHVARRDGLRLGKALKKAVRP